MNTPITSAHLEKALSYAEYLRLSEQLFGVGRTTSESEAYNTPKVLEYTRINRQRIRRLEKTVSIRPELADLISGLSENWVWVVLTESWCGDAAQNLPVIARMAALTPHIDLKILLRDGHPEVMDAYLTNGGRSIPKMVCLQADSLQEIGTWGPRPQILQQFMNELKAAEPDLILDEIIERVHHWYAKDKTRTLQAEFMELIRGWAARL